MGTKKGGMKTISLGSSVVAGGLFISPSPPTPITLPISGPHFPSPFSVGRGGGRKARAHARTHPPSPLFLGFVCVWAGTSQRQKNLPPDPLPREMLARSEETRRVFWVFHLPKTTELEKRKKRNFYRLFCGVFFSFQGIPMKKESLSPPPPRPPPHQRNFM